MVNFIQQFWYLNNTACEKTPRLKFAKEFVCQVLLYVNERLSPVDWQNAKMKAQIKQAQKLVQVDALEMLYNTL